MGSSTNEVREPLKLYFHENTAEQSSMLNTIVTNVLNNMGITSIQAEVVENAVSDYLTENPIRDGVTPNIAVNAIVGELTGTPTVDVTQSGTKENPILNFEFNGLKGEKGGKGDTGATPTVTASATVNQSTGTPSVNVSKSGTDENPNFNFDFSGIKGNKGDKGNTGATPSISVSASADNTIGTPTVNVSKSGTDENPSFSFEFSGIKGEKGNKGDKGDDGLDGFSSRLQQAEYNPSDYLVVDDGTEAKKISVDKFVEGAKENIYGEKNYFLAPNYSASRQGVAVSSDEKGLFTFNGTVRSNDYITFSFDIPNGTYKVKPFGNSNIQSDYLQWYIRKVDRQTNAITFITAINANNENNYVFSVNDAEQYKYTFTITIISGKTYENEQMYPYIYMVADENGTPTNVDLSSRVTSLEGKTSLPMPTVTRDANDITVFDTDTVNANTYASNSANIPQGDNYRVFTIKGANKNYATQFAIGAGNGIPYLRRLIGGTWQPWKRLVTEDDLANKKPTYTALMGNNHIPSATIGTYNGKWRNDDNSQLYEWFNILLQVDGNIIVSHLIPYTRFAQSATTKIALYSPITDTWFYVWIGYDNAHICAQASGDYANKDKTYIKIAGIKY